MPVTLNIVPLEEGNIKVFHYLGNKQHLTVVYFICRRTFMWFTEHNVE